MAENKVELASMIELNKQKNAELAQLKKAKKRAKQEQTRTNEILAITAIVLVTFWPPSALAIAATAIIGAISVNLYKYFNSKSKAKTLAQQEMTDELFLTDEARKNRKTLFTAKGVIYAPKENDAINIAEELSQLEKVLGGLRKDNALLLAKTRGALSGATFGAISIIALQFSGLIAGLTGVALIGALAAPLLIGLAIGSAIGFKLYKNFKKNETLSLNNLFLPTNDFDNDPQNNDHQAHEIGAELTLAMDKLNIVADAQSKSADNIIDDVLEIKSQPVRYSSNNNNNTTNTEGRTKSNPKNKATDKSFGKPGGGGR